MKITLRTLASASPQQVFNQVAAHLMKQMQPALRPGNQPCAYRGREGRVCAVGCLIADDEYDSSMEGKSCDVLWVDGHPIDETHLALLGGLQSLHDYTPVKDWSEDLKARAKVYEFNDYAARPRITLHTLHSATLQEIFDQVALHLMIQGERSFGRLPASDYTNANSCLYRGPNGLQCAAGCLISDAEYNPAFENKLFLAVIADACKKGVVNPGPGREDLVSALQVVHDQPFTSSVTMQSTPIMNLWRSGLKEIAGIYNLGDYVVEDYV